MKNKSPLFFLNDINEDYEIIWKTIKEKLPIFKGEVVKLINNVNK